MSIQGFHKCILVDANFLVALLDASTSEDDKARLNHFIATVEKNKSTLIIPMPAVAEYLVGATVAAVESYNLLERRACIYAAPFDRAAAFECAQLDRAALGAGDKKDGEISPWQKVKVDRQIVAIGKAKGATLVVSQDNGVRNNAIRLGLEVRTIHELDLPDSAKQRKLELVHHHAPKASTPPPI